MKSWMSTRRPACAPPPKIWICGSGSSVASAPPRCRTAARRAAAAAACAAAIETASVALAPRRDLFGVPSSSIRRASSAAWSSARERRRRARAISPRHWRRRAARRGRRRPRRRRAARAPRACPSTRRPGTIARPTAPPASVTSASTVGRPRLSQTRRARTVRIVSVDRSSRELLAPAVGDRCAGDRRRATQQSAARRAARARASASSSKYSTGDLPSTRASNRPGSSAAARCSSAARGSQSTAVEIGLRRAPRSGEEAGRRRRRPQALQQQVVEAEGEVERRVALPGAFGVEEHRAVGADQDVLRADVAVDQRDASSPRSLAPAPRAPARGRDGARAVASR